MKTHVTKVCQAACFHLRNIGKIRQFLDVYSTKILVHSLVTSRIDYCNSLLLGATSQTVDRLQKIQNRAARLITLTKPREHIKPILLSLHWLPVKERINFKVACIIFKCLNNLAPHYLSELLQVYVPSRSLRSMNELYLVTPPFKLSVYDKSFAVGGPKLWNSLSLEVRKAQSLTAFKRSLKTELFKRAFDID